MIGSNTDLTDQVATYERMKQELEEKMRVRRERYAELFGAPLKPTPSAGRKGKPRRAAACVATGVGMISCSDVIMI